MIYLTTGANGSGKTLFTLKDVRDQQIREERPVFFHGFEAGPVITEEFGWKPFDPRKWQELPDGAICVFDECQNEFGTDVGTKDLPEYLTAVAQFRRKRGFDFWMICPHPSLLHTRIRRLVESPSWHRHLKRAFGSDMVSQLKWSAPNIQCEKPGSGGSGEVTMRPYPKEVYGWYKSASLHTGKRRIPRALIVLVVAVVAVPALGYYAFSLLMKRTVGAVPVASAPGAASALRPVALAALPGQPVSAAQSLDFYLTAHRPRIEGFPHTATVYDDVTKPQEAPYPAACVVIRDGCTCWTQQGTKLVMPDPICRQIVAQGFFVDWQRKEAPQRVVDASAKAATPVDAASLPAGHGMHIAGTLRGAAPVAASSDVAPSAGPTVIRAPAPAKS